MRQVLLSVVLAFLACQVSLLAQPEKPLTDTDIVETVKAEFQESFIIKVIEERPTAFDTSTEALVTLREWNVGEKILEAMLAAERRKAPGRQQVPKRPAISQEPQGAAGAVPLKKLGTTEVNFCGDVTYDLPGPRASIWVPTTGAFSQSRARKVLPIGGAGLGVSLTRVVGIYADVAYRNGGHAKAGVGSYSAQAKEWTLESGAGVRLQYPSKSRVRSYFNVGAGLHHGSISARYNLPGGSTIESLSCNAAHLNYGGGLRILARNHCGLRFAVDGCGLRGFKTSSGLSGNVQSALAPGGVLPQCETAPRL